MQLSMVGLHLHAKPLFALLLWLHGIFGNWGWAIIALTILIRAVLYPLTYKGMVSMQKIKEISPKIKELQAKYIRVIHNA